MVNVVFNGFVGSKDYLTLGFHLHSQARQVNHLGPERLSVLPKHIQEITIPSDSYLCLFRSVRYTSSSSKYMRLKWSVFKLGYKYHRYDFIKTIYGLTDCCSHCICWQEVFLHDNYNLIPQFWKILKTQKCPFAAISLYH